jgi:hypothetical protein
MEISISLRSTDWKFPFTAHAGKEPSDAIRQIASFS